MNSRLERWVNATPERKRVYEQECFMSEVTESIYRQMEARNVTKVELAKVLGTSKSNVTQMLSGSRNMTLRTLVDIAHALDMVVSLVLQPQSPAQETCEQCKGARYLSSYNDNGDAYRVPCSACNAMGETPALNRRVE